MTSSEQASASHHDTQPIETGGEVVVAETYDTAAEEGGWDSPERAQRLVEQYVGDGSVVLDIGIGTGQTVEGYSGKGAVIIGLDHDPEMLEAAQSVTGEAGLMRQADINSPLPIGDIAGRVDVAQAIGVLEFADDLGSIVNQVKTTLKPGGVFVFTVETFTGNSDNQSQYYPDADLTLHRHTPDEVHELLDEKGFTLLHDEAYDGYERGDTDTGKVPYRIFLARST